MDEMNPGQQAAVLSLLKLLGVGGLAGGAAAMGAGALRNANPRYNPPEPAKPMIVDIPYPTREHIAGRIPVPRDTSAFVSPKVAFSVKDTLNSAAEWVTDKLPQVHDPRGPTGAQSPQQIPLYYAGVPLAGAAGAIGGFRIGDQLVRALERRRAQSELDEARREYQDSVNTRASRIYFPKEAADFTLLLADTTPTNPDLARAKVALDVVWAKRAEAPTPPPAPDDPTRGGSAVKNLGLAAFFPWLLNRETYPVGMAAMGVGAGIGGMLGYNKARDPEAARAVRSAVESRDRANAAHMTPPVIARLVPVASQGR